MTGRLARPAFSRPVSSGGKRLGPPGAWLAAVAALIYLNQVLFTVYVLRVRGGNPSFIARYLPPGWFRLARWPAIEALARHFPDPDLLAPSVLRVQAFGELPFVVLAYLTVCRWFSADTYRRARALVWPASMVWTVTFCLVEWQLRNPYTNDDLLIRVAAGVVVPLLARRLSDAGPDRPRNLPGLLIFAVSTAAIGSLVLVVYATALLYNLGGLGPELPGAALALAALAAARAAARHVPSRPPGRGIDVIGCSFGWFLVLFFVPALPVRYGLNFGLRDLSIAASVVLITAAACCGAWEAVARAPGRLGAWAGQMALTVLAGLAGASASLLLPASYTETRLLWAAAAFFLCAITVCALLDRVLPAPPALGPAPLPVPPYPATQPTGPGGDGAHAAG
jgi:hypothetical protein